MRHSIYCDCHRCNGVTEPTSRVIRRAHYADGTPPPRRQSLLTALESPPVEVTEVNEQTLRDLQTHFNRR